MTDNEWFDNLKNETLPELIQDLEWFGCDPYYNNMWCAVIMELKKRLL